MADYNEPLKPQNGRVLKDHESTKSYDDYNLYKAHPKKGCSNYKAVPGACCPQLCGACVQHHEGQPATWGEYYTQKNAKMNITEEELPISNNVKCNIFGCPGHKYYGEKCYTYSKNLKYHCTEANCLGHDYKGLTCKEKPEKNTCYKPDCPGHYSKGIVCTTPGVASYSEKVHAEKPQDIDLQWWIDHKLVEEGPEELVSKYDFKTMRYEITTRKTYYLTKETITKLAEKPNPLTIIMPTK